MSIEKLFEKSSFVSELFAEHARIEGLQHDTRLINRSPSLAELDCLGKDVDAADDALHEAKMKIEGVIRAISEGITGYGDDKKGNE